MQGEMFPLYLDAFPFFCAAAEISSPSVCSDFLLAPGTEVMGTGLGIAYFIELQRFKSIQVNFHLG